MRAKKQTYDAVYSLGTNCAASDYLRRMGLRKGAGPFDWIRAEHPRVEGNLFWDEKRITPLFKSISVKRSIGERIKSLKPVWVRIRAAFIWNKTKRHQFVESRLGK